MLGLIEEVGQEAIIQQICDEHFDTKTELYPLYIAPCYTGLPMTENLIHLEGIFLAGTATILGLPPYGKDWVDDLRIQNTFQLDGVDIRFSASELGTIVRAICCPRQSYNSWHARVSVLQEPYLKLQDDFTIFRELADNSFCKQLLQEIMPTSVHLVGVDYLHVLRLYSLIKTGHIITDTTELVDLVPDSDMYPVLLSVPADEPLSRRELAMAWDELNRLIQPLPQLINECTLPDTMDQSIYERFDSELLRLRRALF